MKVAGIIRPPGDKSITHRALLLGAMASGESVIRDPLTALDIKSMARALRGLGAGISPVRPDGVVRVRGLGVGNFRAPGRTLDCGNSGTAARLLLGAVSGCPITVRISGDKSLRGRPMRRVTGPLARMGARIKEERGDGLPITVTGGDLRPFDYESAVASAQVKTALLLAGMMGGVRVSVTEPVRSRDHTERMLAAMAVPIQVAGHTVTLDPPDRLEPFVIDVPADPSSASFLLGVALLASSGELVARNVAVNPTRTGFLSVLARMGAAVEVRNAGESMGEPLGDMFARPSELVGVEVHADEVPSLIDEIPLLAVLASRASGETVFRGVSELRVKESDRLALLARNLSNIGARALADSDTLSVIGSDKPPRGFVDTGGDHRIAMAFAVLSMLPKAAIRLSETESPNVSYPGFFAALESVVQR